MEMIFFCFEHRNVPIRLLSVPLQEWGQLPFRGKFLHIKPPGEPKHYIGHTNQDAMKALAEILRRADLPFVEMEEHGLPEDKRRQIAAMRNAGLLG